MKKAFNYKRLALLFVPLALALIRVVYATEGEVDPSSMVAAHNKWRSEVGVADIMWSEILAETAQAWADNLKRKGCVLEHSKDSDYGENIYWAGPVRWSDGRTEVQSITPQNVVDNWGSEKENYNHGKNSCSGVCGHYTQVVWKNSMEVGCGMAICDNKSQVWVCNYNPPGNVEGEKPYWYLGITGFRTGYL
jgi:pathogenesis-related protein 1